jgi:UDP-N-acetylmuramate--alanine ligase
MGVGGSQVSGLARVFAAQGHQVSGCDVRESDTTRALVAEGVAVSIGHDPAHAAGQDLLVYSTAVSGDGVRELDAARAAGVRVQSRPELLAELIAAHESVAIAGSHGKTTLTTMLGDVLVAAGWDPTVLVGDGASTRPGRGRWLVAEADESNGTLALHRPRHGVLTNVEFDHPDHFRDLEQVDALFRRYLAVVPGVSVVCADDERAAAMPAGGRRVTYGFASEADYRCQDGRVLRRGEDLAELRLLVRGRHNLQNAAGAMAMAVELGVEPAVAAAALASFRGAHRRLERLGTWRGVPVYDDYAVHPTEVRATVAAARELGCRRVIVVFQPHRFTRFAALRDELAEALCDADAFVVTEIYAASEPDPGGLSGAQIAVRVPGARFAPDFAAARQHLEELVREGDLVLVMGAGDVRRLGDELAHAG